MDEPTQSDRSAEEQDALRDLDVDQEEADRVVGGMRSAGDPCDGGEVTTP